MSEEGKGKVENVITILGKEYQILPRYVPTPFGPLLDLSENACATFELHVKGGYGGCGIAISLMVVKVSEGEGT